MVIKIKTQDKSQSRFSRTILSALMLSIMMAPAVSVHAQSGPDNDADGIANQHDLDDDNDGILDVNEGLVDLDNNGVPDASSTDTDGDGIPDALDLDSDNDGVLDNLEAQTDRAAVIALDQNPNGAIDISFNVGSNGIPDAIETAPDSGVLIYGLLDSDNDGMPDFRDTDSDNDGIFDLVEAGGTDNNADGRIDSFNDTDGKGVDDVVQASALPIFDTDGDGTLDYRDSDSDNDGIPDAVESFGSSAANPTDTDNDGAADYREIDSDGDGVADYIEAGSIPSEPADINGDGLRDFQDAGIQNTGETEGIGNGGSNGGDSGAGNGSGITPATDGPDTDGDGIANQFDLDDDNDGIPDVSEGLIDADGNGVADANSRDSDGDGTPDGWDLDSDNDGLLDNREAHPDFNFVSSLDQVVNGAIDIGINVGSNGIADIIETYPDSGVINYAIQDTDSDGTPDFMDTDSDADGISDLVEAGGVDADNDGRIDNFLDADDKGVDDTVQASALPVFDTDGDGAPDYRDTDSDNDGLSDNVEAGVSPNMPKDTDGDGAADYRELDSDGDGISDAEEAGIGTGTGTGTGVCTSGADQSGPDTDGDGISNQNDLDDDNDGIPDTVEGLIDADGNGVADGNSRDTDGDGVPDGWDLDSDNDGLLDNREAHPDFAFVSSLDQVVNGAIDIGIAVGCNGLANIIENGADSGQLNFAIQDTDGDGVADYIDLDSDNDGIPDLVEAGGIDADGNGRIDNFFDGDDKGVDDAVQSSALPVFDTDGNGVEDYRDTDSDGDSIPDSVEAGSMPSQPTDTDGDGAADYREQDSDNDTIPDNQEVGADPSNPVDSNGDGIPDFQDAGVSTGAPVAGPISNDVDGDGILNDHDLDSDNDGLLDSVEGEGDTDNDTTLDKFDLDSDNDGISDLVEAAVDHPSLMELDADQDGRIDSPVGANGFADILETSHDSGVATFIAADTDADGVPDFQDLDSDNDGIADAHEAAHVTDSHGRLVGASNSLGMVAGASNHVLDTDFDGVVDHRDLDSDNDGLSDVVESNGVDADKDGHVDDFIDNNGDGAHDGLQTGVVGLIDTDSDHHPDYRDLDSDQDSLSDLLESQGVSADLDNNGVLDVFADGNNDGLDDNVASISVLVRDTDRDGIPDHVDIDSDGDGLNDLVEAGRADINNDGIVDSLADTDNDGIPDIVDVSITLGTDSDLDGIDDMFDVSFAGISDIDGDGIADQFDPDSDGNGFAGPSDDGQGSLIQLPDTNGNGTPDVQETGAAAVGTSIETGLGGSGVGCTITSGPQGPSKGPDPILLLMLFASVASLAWRSLRRVASRPAQNQKGLRKAGLVAAAVSSVAVSGCGTINLDSLSMGNLGNFGGGERAANPHKARIYAGAGGLVSILEPNTDNDNSVSIDNGQSFGGSVQLGYDITNRFSIEGHASSLGEATLKPAGSIGYQVAGLSALVYGINNVDDRGRREGLSVFGRLGAGTMRNQGNSVRFKRLNDYHLLAGAGVEYGMANGFAVRGELVAHETDAKYAQVGVVYRIGDAGSRRRAPEPISVPTPDVTQLDMPEVYTEPVFEQPMIEPPMDSDADGVLDSMDSCPNTGARVPVDNLGCAIFNGVIEGINFESGSDRLTAGAQQVLNGVAATLNQYPDVRVAVEAHTDNQGAADFNLQLSKRRAIAVARYLVEQGIPGPRLKPQAFGESQPRESNATAAGRSRNRRVEFQVVQ